MLRLRVKFSRGEQVKFISHLDIIRLWQRAFRRADVPLAYSEGFNPHPKISLAAPLPLGVTSESELMDIFLSRWVTPHHFTSAVGRELPGGMGILQVYAIGFNVPSLQSQVAFAEYRVEVEAEKERKDAESAVASLLMKKSLPWQHQRDTGVRNYDLRALVDELSIIDWREKNGVLGMKLRCDAGGSGRPEQVTLALGFTGRPRLVHRTGLILKGQ